MRSRREERPQLPLSLEVDIFLQSGVHLRQASLPGQAVRFRFELTNGSLYAFWVSQDETGPAMAMLRQVDRAIRAPPIPLAALRWKDKQIKHGTLQ